MASTSMAVGSAYNVLFSTRSLRWKGLNICLFSSASMNPLDWFRRQINPTVRDRKSNADIEVAKRKQAEEGTLSVFDSSAAAAEEKKPAAAKDTSMVVKTRSDHVRRQLAALTQLFTDVECSSTNTRRRTSKSLTESSIRLAGRSLASQSTLPSCR